MQKKFLKITAVVVLILTFCLSVIIPSADNLKNLIRKNPTARFSVSELTLEGLTQDGDQYRAGEGGGYLTLTGLQGHTASVRVSGYYEGDAPDELTVCAGGAEKTVGVRVNGNQFYILTETDTPELRIRIAEENTVLRLKSVTVNARSPIFSIQAVAKYCILPTIALMAVLLLIFYRKELIPYLMKFKRYLPLVGNLVSRDLKVKYRRSILGFLWSILNPLLMALVINAVFSSIFRYNVDYFATYYLVGSLIFNFVVEATTASMTSVIGAAGLIRKVYIPKYIFCFQKCVFALINMLFGSVAVIVVMLIQGVPFRPQMFLFFIPMIYAFLFAFGFGLFLAAFTVFFRDMLHLYSVFTMIWMYLTPIIYPESLLQSNGLGFILKLNPLYYLTKMFREVVMYGQVPALSEHLMCITFALILLVFGTVSFKKMQDKFILYV